MGCVTTAKPASEIPGFTRDDRSLRRRLNKGRDVRAKLVANRVIGVGRVPAGITVHRDPTPELGRQVLHRILDVVITADEIVVARRDEHAQTRVRVHRGAQTPGSYSAAHSRRRFGAVAPAAGAAGPPRFHRTDIQSPRNVVAGG